MALSNQLASFSSSARRPGSRPPPDVARFTLANWGTAWTFGAGAITNGPANGTLYLRGAGARRVPVALDKNGYGRFTEADELYLAPGDNKLRVEQENGLLFQAGASFSISFGDTYTRFL